MSESSEESRQPSVLRARLMIVQLSQHLRPAILSLVTLTLLTCGLYPLVLLGLGQWMFPTQAAGSLTMRGGVVVGSRLIGQGFQKPEYFHTRASAAGSGYDATQSAGTNLAPANPKLLLSVRASAADFRNSNRLTSSTEVPMDAVTSSASGLDPDISPENAVLQVSRVARARGLSEALVAALVAKKTRGRDLFFLGAPRVPVLELNLELDRHTQPVHR